MNQFYTLKWTEQLFKSSAQMHQLYWSIHQKNHQMHSIFLFHLHTWRNKLQAKFSQIIYFSLHTKQIISHHQRIRSFKESNCMHRSLLMLKVSNDSNAFFCIKLIELQSTSDSELCHMKLLLLFIKEQSRQGQKKPQIIGIMYTLDRSPQRRLSRVTSQMSHLKSKESQWEPIWNGYPSI